MKRAREEPSPAGLLDLPDEILREHVLARLDHGPDAARVARACKRLRAVARAVEWRSGAAPADERGTEDAVEAFRRGDVAGFRTFTANLAGHPRPYRVLASMARFGVAARALSLRVGSPADVVDAADALGKGMARVERLEVAVVGGLAARPARGRRPGPGLFPAVRELALSFDGDGDGDGAGAAGLIARFPGLRSLRLCAPRWDEEAALAAVAVAPSLRALDLDLGADARVGALAARILRGGAVGSLRLAGALCVREDREALEAAAEPGRRLECAELRVPLDEADPAALTRAAGLAPARVAVVSEGEPEPARLAALGDWLATLGPFELRAALPSYAASLALLGATGRARVVRYRRGTPLGLGHPDAAREIAAVAARRIHARLHYEFDARADGIGSLAVLRGLEPIADAGRRAKAVVCGFPKELGPRAIEVLHGWGFEDSLLRAKLQHVHGGA